MMLVSEDNGAIKGTSTHNDGNDFEKAEPVLELK